MDFRIQKCFGKDPERGWLKEKLAQRLTIDRGCVYFSGTCFMIVDQT